MFFFLRDPFIDDNIEFARRLSSLNVTHQLTVVDEWPHGFLDFGLAANDIAAFNLEMLTMIRNIVQQQSSSNTHSSGDVTSKPTFTD